MRRKKVGKKKGVKMGNGDWGMGNVKEGRRKGVKEKASKRNTSDSTSMEGKTMSEG